MWLAGGCKETPEEMTEIIHSEYQGRMQKDRDEKPLNLL